MRQRVGAGSNGLKPEDKSRGRVVVQLTTNWKGNPSLGLTDPERSGGLKINDGGCLRRRPALPPRYFFLLPGGHLDGNFKP